MNGGTINVERVQVEEMDEGKKSAKKKRTMAKQKNAMQGCGKETGSVVDWAGVPPKKLK